MTIRWSSAIPVWWSIAWRGSLYGLVLGAILGGIGGAIAAFSGMPEKGTLYGTIGGYIAAIPASLLAVKQGLSKHLAALAAIVKENVA